jgi:hypothetical protein
MPFKSKAQWRRMFAAEARGEVRRGTAERFAHETRKPFASLPQHAHHSPVDSMALLEMLESARFHTRYPGFAAMFNTGHVSANDQHLYFVARIPEAAAMKGRLSRRPVWLVFHFDMNTNRFSMTDPMPLSEATEQARDFAAR